MSAEKTQRQLMWKEMLALVVDSIENQQLPHILNVIRNNLFNEDPGLLSAVIGENCDEIDCEESLNIWLLNQVVVYAASHDDKSSNQQLVKFQSMFLSASLFRKQRIFQNVLRSYIKFTRELIEQNAVEENSSHDIFNCQKNERKFITEFLPNAEYQQVILATNSQREKMLAMNIQIFIHILPASLDLHLDDFEECSNCILDVFNICEMDTKYLCLEYFYEVLKNNFQFGQKFLHEILKLIKKILEILELLNERDNNCQELEKLMILLFDVISMNCKRIDAIHKKDFIFMQLNILKCVTDSKGLSSFSEIDKIIEKIIDSLINCREFVFDFDVLMKTLYLYEKYPKIIALLEHSITNELVQYDLMTTEIKVLDCCKIWTRVDKTLMENINSLAEMTNDQKFERILKIFELIAQINFNYNCHYNLKYKLIFINSFIEFEDKLKIFLNNISKNHDMTRDTFRLLIEFFDALINSRVFDNFNEKFQNATIDLTISYLRKVVNISDGFPFNKILMENCFNEKTVRLLSHIDGTIVKNVNNFKQKLIPIIQRIFSRNDLDKMKEICSFYLFNFVFNSLISTKFIEVAVIKVFPNETSKSKVWIKLLKSVICYFHGDILVLKNDEFNYKIICKQCDQLDDSEGIIVNCDYLNPKTPVTLKKNQLNSFFEYLNEENSEEFQQILNHTDFINDNNILKNWSLLMPKIAELVVQEDLQLQNRILKIFIEDLLAVVDSCLQKNDKAEQKKVLNLISKFINIKKLPEKIVYYLFKLIIMFLIRKESHVTQEGSRLAIELCHKQGYVPRNFLVWYQRDLFKLIISLCAAMYLSTGFGLQKSLHCVSRMLGFKGPREFTYRNYEMIVTMLIEFCVFDANCEDLLNEVVFFTKIELKEILKKSFLSFYLEYFIDKNCPKSNDCLDFILKKTECDIFSLINSDIKKTVAKMLIYYHKNPKTVMETFRCLLLKENNKDPQLSSLNQSSDVIKFIADRFLGVITFFEIYLISSDFEKSLKTEILQSLGEIIRLLGSKYVTSFHFKILATLTTVIALDDENLKEICIEVWKIFIHNVDIQVIGASLSRIVAALEPLLIFNEKEVNSIYTFLIISNGNLLSKYIPELYFIENLNVCDEVKNFVSQQINKKWNTHCLKDKMQFFVKEITHENVIIRVNGLKYLKKLFADNRKELNKMILGQNFVSPLIENIVESLIVGCKHVDKNLKIASGQCIGELGAIEPALFRPNYSQQNTEFPLDVHSDAFAIMGLKELCKAYQFQKDTLYVDNFSLGIQEILVARNVCPKKKTKMEVWEAIPERMRQIMEPLLTSCYTGMQKNENTHVHPVFGSKYGKSVEEWSFNWSSNMIEKINFADTKHLLNSLLPSIRRDSNVLGVFLPYILLHSLQNSVPEYCEIVFEELQFVFKSVMDKNCESLDIPNKYYDIPYLQLDSMPSEKLINTSNDFKSDNIGIKCAKIGFELLDFLEKWMYEYSNIFLLENEYYSPVKKFCQKFNYIDLAHVNFNCGEYARALKYCEAYIEKMSSDSNDTNDKNIQEHLSFLIKIYVELLDSDSLEGAILMKKSKSSLKEQILVYSMTDNLQEMAACYEQLIKDSEVSNELYELDSSDWDGIVQCYLRMDTPETALIISQGIMKKLGDKYMNDCLKESQVEPLWRLGRFDELDELLKNSDIQESNNWPLQCGRALLLFHKCNDEDSVAVFETQIDAIRQDVLKVMKFGRTDCDSYHKEYLQVTKLQILTDIEKCRVLIKKISKCNESANDCTEALKDFLEDWNARLEFLQPTIKITEPFLCVRRAILNEAKNLIRSVVGEESHKNIVNNLYEIINEEIGNLWMKSVQHNIEAGCFQQAHLSILNAEKYQPNNLFIEKAKLYWKKGDQSNCFKVIEDKINELEGSGVVINKLPLKMQLLYSEAKFLQASYNAESMNISADLNIKYFADSLEYNSKSEKTYVTLAQYFDRIYSTMTKNSNKSKSNEEYLLRVLYNYGKSMLFGCEYIFQSMPRMLSIWFAINSPGKSKNSMFEISDPLKVHKINKFMDQTSQCLPLTLYFTAFSQLISRICHPCENVWNILKTIIVRLIEKYPQRSLWMILPVFKSSLSARVVRCIAIYNDKRLSDPSLQKLIKDFNILAQKLIELTDHELPRLTEKKKLTISHIIPALPKIFADKEFSPIMIPFEKYMQMTLPPLGERSASLGNFNPFPNTVVYIRDIQNEIDVLFSLQKPKKVTLIGNDGKNYTIMLKPKDDLRKDFRLMEFNGVVQQYLYQDGEARQRRLRIRTYAVQPLNEECGLIEWIHNLKPFRHILMDIYSKKNLGMSNKDLKKYMIREENAMKRRDIFYQLLSKHPPVFDKWFLQAFPNPHNWYQARTSYIRTTSVMSIVGYILGLGDRHGENIMFDESTGDIVHVDFSCLFNFGETLAIPEKVPFRLTHNMVHAMGPLGTEGPFKKCSEITMRVLQAQTPILMSVLKPFIYDPLVTWRKSMKSNRNVEITDENAISNVKRIEARLQGYINDEDTGANMPMPLSPEGVVNDVILKATNIDNLACMYIGWGAFL